MKTYKLHTFEDGSEFLEIVDESGKVWGVPIDESNSDYQAYLSWVEAGGVAEVVAG